MTSHSSEMPDPGNGAYRPSLRDMVMLDLPTGVKLAPSGNRAAVLVRTTNWKGNRYETVCYVHDLAIGAHPINRTGSYRSAGNLP